MAVDEPPAKLDVLDFALHILLRQQYRSGCGHETPRPVTSGIAMKHNRKHRVAGPSCMILHDVNQFNSRYSTIYSKGISRSIKW